MSLRDHLDSMDDYIRLGMFLLMCLGLLISTLLLWHDKISGDNWTMLCTVLFGSQHVGQVGAKLASRS